MEALQGLAGYAPGTNHGIINWPDHLSNSG